MIDIKKKEQTQCIEHVKSCYTKSMNFQRPYFTNFNDYYRIYRAKRDNGKQNYAGRAQLFIPYVFSTIETIVPRLIGNKPKIEATPREPGDINKAKAHGAIFDYEWDMMDMKEVLKSWVKQTLIYGTGIIKTYWEFDEDKDIDMPKAELVDLFDFFVDPGATNVANAKYIIHRSERDLSELKGNANYDVPKGLDTRVQQDEYKVQRDSILGLSKPTDNNFKKVEVLEYWGEYDFGDGPEEALITIANREFLIRAEKNPYDHNEKPFVRMIDIEDPHNFFGIGEVEQLSSLQYELNDVRNQRMDNVTLILNRMWKVVKTGDVDEEDLVSQAGQIIHVGDLNALEPLVTPDVTASAYNEEGLIKQDMQYVSGVNDYVVGNAGSSSQTGGTGSLNRTATGVMLMQEAGNARFKYKLDNIEDSLKHFGRLLLGMNQQFITEELMLRITGKSNNEWLQIPKEEIKGNFDVTVEGGSTQPMNKSVRRAEARELLNAMVPLTQMGVPINLMYFVKNLLETYDLQNTDEALGQTPSVPQPGMEQPAPGTAPVGAEPSIGTTAVDGLSGPEFTGLPTETLANAGNG